MTLAPPPPPRLEHLPAGTKLIAGLGHATVLADMDFETYSEAGYDWNEGLQKWVALPGASGNKKGLTIVGAAVYAEHPSTEILSLYYDLKDGRGRQHWRAGMLPPLDLFMHIRNGGLIEAWNKGFETWIWEKVCMPKLGWPPLPMSQMRCAMAKARAFGLPGKLEKTGEVLQLENQKLKDGDRLLKKFSVPRQPTAKNKAKRLYPHEDPVDGPLFYGYNERDIVAEAEASSRIPDLTGEELEFWQADMDINHRGVQIDIDGVENCIAIIDQAHARYNAELATLTGGDVMRASELAKLQAWFSKYGLHFVSLDEENIDAALSRTDLPAWARRALEIRQAIGSAAVKKVYAMRLQATRAGRLHDLFSYHAAHTGRVTGNGPQPTNLPNSGPAVLKCGCGHYFGKQHMICPWCAKPLSPVQKTEEWSWRAAADALTVISSRSLDMVEYYFGDAMGAISGVLRGLFVAAEGYDLMCSDYASIEAVVLAEVAGEQWRRDVFRTHGKIYEAGAAAVTGIPFSDFMKAAGYTDAELAAPDWYARPPAAPTGTHHIMRKKVGKISELASGYGGWIGAWKAFGADEFMTDQEMKDAILAWRAASPAIVEFWGGQERRGMGGRRYPEMYGVEGMFISAVLNLGVEYEFRGFKFLYRGDALHLRLLSGRTLTYHRPRLRPSDRGGLAISYEGWNTNPKNGPTGWIRKDTWGGRLTENIVQAVARDILRYAIISLERAGYRVVLHVYDEIVAEILKLWGSIEEFEKIMADMPAWAAGWPIRAMGGWRGPRYRK
jgi:DNA polymerase